MSMIVSERELTLPAVGPNAAPQGQSVSIERSAFYLESEGQPLFAWLHTTSSTRTLDHGIVICAPVGHEQLHAHRGLRHLADALAGWNVPVLRFDWHGTGDSAGLDGDPDRVCTWKANLRDAIRWMRGQLGCRRISVIGLRVGATLAASFSCDEEIENLILWSPIVKGRAYAREMLAVDLTGELRPKPKNANPKDVEAAGFLLTEENAADLSKLNLLKDPVKCRRALIVAQAELPEDGQLVDRLTSLGIPVEQFAVTGLSGMLTEPHHGSVPQEAIQQIAAWCGRHLEDSSMADVRAMSDDASLAGSDLGLLAGRAVLGPRRITLQHRPELPISDGTGRSVHEQAVRISEAPQLFGILSVPETITEDLPTIVLLNAGASYRIGPGRLHVHMAREFAARGFRCLRLDLCGLGDSVTQSPDRENDSYAATAFRDVQLTLQFLRERLGVQQCVLAGLCSGAYVAFQSAAQLSDPMLVESVLINPLTFFWKTGMTLDSAPIHDVLAKNYYLNVIRRPEKWLKLFSGRSRTGWLKAGRLLLSFLKKKRKKPAPINRHHGGSATEPGHPAQDNLPADLVRVASAGRQLSMYFAKSDPGYRLLTNRAAREVRKQQKSGNLQISFIDEADHTFSRRVTRQALIERIANDLLQRYKGGPERDGR